jgi:hypothetical protein
MRLDDVFGSWEGFVAESQLHQFEALKSEIEDIRSHEDIAGYVVTQLTDVHWESNGLLDMARNPKVFHHRMQQLNAADVLVGRPTRRRALAGDVVDIDVLLSHFSHRKIGACVLSWEAPELELRGELDVDAAFSPASVVRLPRIAIPVASDLPAAARLHVRLALRERFGRDVARGDVTLLALPDVRPAATFAVCVDDAHLAGTLDARGWPKDDDGVIVARAWGQGHRSSRARRWARARVPLTRGAVRQAGRRGAPGPRPSVGGRLAWRDGVAQA